MVLIPDMVIISFATGIIVGVVGTKLLEDYINLKRQFKKSEKK